MVRPHELECCHGVGHQLGVHGCDGCCGRIFGGLVEQTEDRIIKLLEEGSEFESADYVFSKIISSREFKLPDGNDVIEINDAWEAFAKQREWLIELIKGETK